MRHLPCMRRAPAPSFMRSALADWATAIPTFVPDVFSRSPPPPPNTTAHIRNQWLIRGGGGRWCSGADVVVLIWFARSMSRGYKWKKKISKLLHLFQSYDAEPNTYDSRLYNMSKTFFVQWGTEYLHAACLEIPNEKKDFRNRFICSKVMYTYVSGIYDMSKILLDAIVPCGQHFTTVWFTAALPTSHNLSLSF